MMYKVDSVKLAQMQLKKRFETLDNKTDILKAPEMRALLADIPNIPESERANYGKEVNGLRDELKEMAKSHQTGSSNVSGIDVTAPFDANSSPDRRPRLLDTTLGTVHPLMSELDKILDIFYRMGFDSMESRQIDDDYHMFGSLNFPEGHPARDDYDTLVTVEKDKNNQPYIAPAHVSTTQNRLMKKYKANLLKGRPIAVVYTGRTYRNEDLDAQHEHTFYQVEISYIDRNINAGNLVATIKSWLSSYYERDIDVKIQPFYFPFTEPSFEFAASCVFCNKSGCSICSYSGWIELGGCGMIHPKVLQEGGIDPDVFSGFAGGFGLDRLVMLKYGITDIRLFESGRLDFLRQFK
jgi:phenylalanyl-tRNA synthetase alpha chain